MLTYGSSPHDILLHLLGSIALTKRCVIQARPKSLRSDPSLATNNYTRLSFKKRAESDLEQEELIPSLLIMWLFDGILVR